MRERAVVIANLVLLVVMAACGGGGSSPPTPTSPTAAAISGATISITAAGAVSPNSVRVAVGQGVTFINQDTRPHEPSSDPHPLHTDCPELAAVGQLQPGQSRTSSAFATARVCTFHDHLSSADALRGTIAIQ